MTEGKSDLMCLFERRDQEKEARNRPKYDAVDGEEVKRLLDRKNKRKKIEEAEIDDVLRDVISKLVRGSKEDAEWREASELEFVPDMSNLLVKALIVDEEAGCVGGDAVCPAVTFPAPPNNRAKRTGLPARPSNSPLNFLEKKLLNRASYKPKLIEGLRRAEVDGDSLIEQVKNQEASGWAHRLKLASQHNGGSVYVPPYKRALDNGAVRPVPNLDDNFPALAATQKKAQD